MAALSSAVSNHSAETSTTTTAAAVSSTTLLTTNASKNLRGLNKPKCIKCGNVARSRCPFQSCKSCCAKAQNPCHIHVLKGSSNIPEKLPSSSSPKVDQQPSDVSHSGNPHRVASLRQLSSNFAQFNNLRPARSRKPLTRKDAQVLNEWRFLKLKEFKDGEIETENEAFDRYVQNVSLLEEVFSVHTKLDEETEDGGASTTNSGQASVDKNMDAVIAGLKTKFRSNPVRIDNIRKRIQYIVGKGLRKLRSSELNDGASDLGDPDDLGNRPKKLKSERAERAAVMTDLIDKLNKARTDEDIKACSEMHSQLLHEQKITSQVQSYCVDESVKQISIDGLSPEQSLYSPPKWFRAITIDQEYLCQIDSQFSSLEEIEDL